MGADAYTGCEEVILKNPILTLGSACPCCAESNTFATLSLDKPKFFIRLVGSPSITGTRYEAPTFRCNLCNTRFQTPVPDAIKNAPKYDPSVATTLVISRYYLGLPFYRIEQNQAMHGIPMADATQWDLTKSFYPVALSVFGALSEKASNGDLMIYDDTPGRTLENQAQKLATHTTAFISVVAGYKIHLFFTGRKHAGQNTDAILSKRTSEKPVIAMMDASPHNLPKQLSASLLPRFILCFCLVHGRRKFFEIFNFFGKECKLVLDIIGQVYANDTHCRAEKLSAQARLLYHQKHSKPLMETLFIWLNNQLLYEEIEANSGLGNAVRYMLRHWIPLTTFLRVAGAPLDSSWAERAIKIAIRHRRNSLFYKTNKGAEVGDCFMSLIYTANQNGINPYDYLNSLQRYPAEVKANPNDWLPWNYLATIASIAEKKAA